MNTTTIKHDCEIDGHWGACGVSGNYSPYKHGIGKAVALITYEINQGSEDEGSQYEYYVCAECFYCEQMEDGEEIDGHHLVNTQFINGNDRASVAKIYEANREKASKYHKRNPMTKKMKAKIDKYFAIKESDDWEKTYKDIFEN